MQMLDVVRATSRALSENDTNTLEQMALQAEMGRCRNQEDTAALAKAAMVLTAQVNAAAAHIALRSRILAAQDGYERNTWDR